MALKDTIFGLFGNYEKQIDINKDGNGKGTFERYNEAIGNYSDTQITPFIDNFARQLINPYDCILELLPFLENNAGFTDNSFLSLGYSVEMRRRVVKWAGDINAIKGTKKCYTILFQMLFNQYPDLTITYEEIFRDYRYDTGIRADTNIRYDINSISTTCVNSCTPYSINLYSSFVQIQGLSDTTNVLTDVFNVLTDGSMTINTNNNTTEAQIITPDAYYFVNSIINYCNPIDANCTGVYLNTIKIY